MYNGYIPSSIPARGCAAAVLRLWLSPDSDMPPIEMCGEKPAMENWQYVTQGQTARISFTSADKAIGAQVSNVVVVDVCGHVLTTKSSP